MFGISFYKVLIVGSGFQAQSDVGVDQVRSFQIWWVTYGKNAEKAAARALGRVAEQWSDGYRSHHKIVPNLKVEAIEKIGSFAAVFSSPSGYVFNSDAPI